jgi:hypothetical protein
MVKMFSKFCELTNWDASAIIVYFGVYSKGKLAEFLHEHLTDTFVQWQKYHPHRDRTEMAMVLSGDGLVISPAGPYQVCHVHMLACWHRCCISWHASFFTVKDLRPWHKHVNPWLWIKLIMCCLHNFDLLLSNNSFNFPSIPPQKETATGKHESGTRQHLPAQYDQGHMLEF